MASCPLPHTPPAADRPIRVMIVDDSLVARTVLSRILEVRAEFEVAAVAAHAAQAIELLASVRVDAVLLDVEMPGMDGLTALPAILAAAHGAHVLIVSSAAEVGAVATVKALTLGAADTLLKPGAGSFAGRFADELIERLLRIGHAGEIPVATMTAAPPPQRREPIRHDPVACLAIGASTGGMHALSAFFRVLDRRFTAPILITQHLPTVFMPYFAAQLQELAGRPARVATHGERIVPGEILVAPGDAHLSVMPMRGGPRIRLMDHAERSGCMPSVDPMLAGVAHTFGAEGLGMMLSGMGRDGLTGAGVLVKAGGEMLAQDAASSVVWGMPRGVAETGLASAVLPPVELAARVAERVGLSAWK